MGKVSAKPEVLVHRTAWNWTGSWHKRGLKKAMIEDRPRAEQNLHTEIEFKDLADRLKEEMT